MNARRLAYQALYAIFIALGAVYLWEYRESLAALSGHSLATLLALCALFHLGVAANAVQLTIVGRHYGRGITAARAYVINLVHGYCNLVVPLKGAIAIKGYALNTIYRLSWVEYAAGLVLAAATTIVGSLAGAGIGISLGARSGAAALVPGSVDARLAWLLGGGLVVLALLVALRGKARIARLLEAISGKVDLFLSPRVWAISLGAYAAFLAASAARLALLCASVAGVAPLGPSLLVASVVALGRLVSVTPGNLGVREAIIVMLGDPLGLDVEQALVVALSDRAIMVANQVGFGLALQSRVLRWMQHAA